MAYHALCDFGGTPRCLNQGRCPTMKEEFEMKRMAMLAMVLAAGVLCFSAGLVYSAQGRVSEEERELFIENFERINLNTTPGDAMMLRILVQASGAKNGIEVGSSTGYGAIQMGVGFERNGGHLTTLEIDPETVVTCRENLKKAGVDHVVTCIEGDALKTIGPLEGEFDFVFIDAMKTDYLKYLQLIEPKLKVGAIVVGDNVIKSGSKMPDFLDYVQNSPNYETVIIRASEEKGDGMSISYKVR
jgi:predicted O-methyltransferase YrrM